MKYYEELENGLPVEDASDYAKLVVADDNRLRPVHRWFRMKESFSADLLSRVVKDTNVDHGGNLRIVDPFAGAGTTAVSAGQDYERLGRVTAYGVETNPFLHLLASTKLRAMQNPPTGFESVVKRVLKRATAEPDRRYDVPGLSTFRNPAYFPEGPLRELLAITAAIDDLREEHTLEADLCRVALGATVEPVSRLRRDGRALRYTPAKPVFDAAKEFARRCAIVAADLPNAGVAVSGRQVLGDGRTLSGLPRDLVPFDLAVFSPPYPNNIDYTEVYKLEAWLLGLIRDQAEFRAQRLRSLHSHPSIRREQDTNALSKKLAPLLAPIIGAIPESRYAESLREMVSGYVHDLAQTLVSLRPRLRSPARVAVVVGNSLHGSGPEAIVVAADILLSAAAEQLGFICERIAVARHLRRRGHSSQFLRESICFFGLA